MDQEQSQHFSYKNFFFLKNLWCLKCEIVVVVQANGNCFLPKYFEKACNWAWQMAAKSEFSFSLLFVNDVRGWDAFDGIGNERMDGYAMMDGPMGKMQRWWHNKNKKHGWDDKKCENSIWAVSIHRCCCSLFRRRPSQHIRLLHRCCKCNWRMAFWWLSRYDIA